jgi:hypothetical protein
LSDWRKAVGEISGDSIELRRERGKEFQTVGAETEKDRSPKDLAKWGKESHLKSYKGNRFNHLFETVVALHLHKDVVDCLDNYATSHNGKPAVEMRQIIWSVHQSRI